MNKYEIEMLDLMKEQNDLLVEIIQLKGEINNTRDKHIKDYKKRELFKKYEELLESCLDTQSLFYNLLK